MLRPGLALVLLTALAAGAFAQEPLPAERLDELEGRFRAVAVQTRPASVAVLGLMGMGSGVVIDRSGLVLTNAHVAVAARWCAVVFPDGRRVLGRRLGIYFPRDLALIQLPEGEYDAVEFAAAGSAKAGDWVVAYGHPGGLKPDRQPTYSAGQVTGKVGGVAVAGILDYSGGIQTDLAIYSGNSGGPLFDLEGRLVGINGAVNPAAGESYSLSVDILEAVLPKIRQEKIYLSDDLVLDPRSPQLAPLFEAYDGFSRKVAETWIEAGWPGEHMPAEGETPGDLERWATRVLDRIDSARSRLEDIPIWRGRHAQEREERLAASFAGVFEGSRHRTVRVLGLGSRTACLGTVVEPGRFVTKASLAGERRTLFAETEDGTRVAASLVATNAVHDLALYEAVGLAAPETADGAGPEVGSWVLVPGGRGTRLAVGVLSAQARPIPAATDSLVPDAIQRGILFAVARLLRQAPEETGLPGLADRLESGDRQRRLFELGNSPRTYPRVLQHDAPLDVDHMGGPVLDGEGRLLGVNVARAHHGTVYAVPIDVVRETFREALEGED